MWNSVDPYRTAVKFLQRSVYVFETPHCVQRCALRSVFANPLE
jgi:hypothetical protein